MQFVACLQQAYTLLETDSEVRINGVTRPRALMTANASYLNLIKEQQHMAGGRCMQKRQSAMCCKGLRELH